MSRSSATPRRGRNPPRKHPAPRGVRIVLVTMACVTIAIIGGFTREWMAGNGDQSKTGRVTQHVERRRGPLTFHQDIAPLIHQRCATCHRPDEAAPFSLLSYDDVRSRAADIVAVTERRAMPPWLPQAGGPPLRDEEERRLTDEEIDRIRKWVAEGTAEGQPDLQAESLMPQSQGRGGWKLGQPDLIVEMPEAYPLAAGGRDVYRNFVIPLALTQRRFVRALEFKPNTRVIHHVFIRFDRSQQSRRLDTQDAEAGFGGMSLPPGVESAAGHFLSWQPGRGPTLSPDGLAWPLEPGRDLILQAHLQPSGKPELVRPTIGFYFTDQAPTNTPFKLVLSSIHIDLPAGSRDSVVEDSHVLSADVHLMSVLPHAHYLAKEMLALALLPSGETIRLLSISEWDFNWQSDFRYVEPVFLPRGTRLSMRYTYDNSINNPRNPNQPPRPVRFGLQSTDEMAEFWLQLLPRTSEDRRNLEADAERRLLRDVMDFNVETLRQDPTNSHAHVQLAKALGLTGRVDQALTHLYQAVRINPEQEEGHYHIGVFLMERSPAEAEDAFLRTLRINPENFKARNNLGLIFMRTGRMAEAETQFALALEKNPNDTLIRDNLNLVRRYRQAP